MADTESQERRDQQIAQLEHQLECEASRAVQYRNQLSALQSLFQRVSRALGCTTTEELETLVFGNRTIWNRLNIEHNARRVATLKDEVKAAKEKAANMETEGEARLNQLIAREEAVESLQAQLSQTKAERDAATADLIAARHAMTSAEKRYNEAADEIRAVRLAHNNMRKTHLSMQARAQEERVRRQSQNELLLKASEKSKDALYQAAMRIVIAYQRHRGQTNSDYEVKLKGTDSDGALLSPVTKGKGKEARTSSVHGIDSAPLSAPIAFGTSSIPNTPTKPGRTAAAEALSNIHPTVIPASTSNPSNRLPAAAFTSTADTSDVLPSSHALGGPSTKPSPARRSPRKSTPQKRKRPTDENDDGGDDEHAPPSSPRSDVSATQDETQAPRLQFTPTKRARRTSELPTSLPRPLNALVLSANRDLSSLASDTPADRGPRVTPESLPPPPRAAHASEHPFLRTRPATSPRRTSNGKRASLLSPGSPGRSKVSPKILRTYSKQLKWPVTRGADTPFEEKEARKRGRYSAPEPPTSRVQQYNGDDTETEQEEVGDEVNKKAFPYEEVVRGKRRKELDAEDCEECREYYEAVGPMPPRLQAPLWRSPKSSPRHHRHVHYHNHRHEPAPAASSSKRGNERIETTRPRGDEHYDPDLDAAFFAHQNEAQRSKQVDSHRQQISRHRAVFARPKTPPGFWDIDFPDTPKVDRLNKEAYDMHMKKESTNKKR